MNEKYLPQDPAGRMARLVEECGEVLQALGKAVRFGMQNSHPKGGPNNREALLLELDDLIHAANAVKADLYEVGRLETLALNKDAA
jgi:NTP pyrophosphatase (non-canonical NTP hydrolase)